ncbi:MAG TPA: hypothetical protein VKP30_19940, partial [Polyangiaceae bacterium]|nr:hypothetical protein [Polyangiaceae bacterium]
MHLVSTARFPSPLLAEATIESHAVHDYRLNLRTSQAGVTGERSFSGRSCRAVSDAAIVTMALSLDPNLTLPPDRSAERESTQTDEQARAQPSDRSAQRKPSSMDEPAHVQPPDRSAQRESTQTDEQARAPQQTETKENESEVSPRAIPVDPEPRRTFARTVSRPRRVRFETAEQVTLAHGFVQGLVGWNWGVLPESTGQVGLAFGVQRASLSFQLQASLSPTVTRYSRRKPAVGGAFFWMMGGLQACWTAKVQQFS